MLPNLAIRDSRILVFLVPLVFFVVIFILICQCICLRESVSIRPESAVIYSEAPVATVVVQVDKEEATPIYPVQGSVEMTPMNNENAAPGPPYFPGYAQ